eukprot:6477361-Amphidinium_carterae.1
MGSSLEVHEGSEYISLPQPGASADASLQSDDTACAPQSLKPQVPVMRALIKQAISGTGGELLEALDCRIYNAVLCEKLLENLEILDCQNLQPGAVR